MLNIDKVLHAERTASGGGKRTFYAPLEALPLGTIFEHESTACLVTGAGYLPWSFGGYGAPKSIDQVTVVKVLTPRSVVRAFATGFTPAIHPSAQLSS
jgi:hypothetical protein